MKHECNWVSAMSVKTVRLSGQFAVHLYAGTLVFSVSGRFILILKFTVLSSGFIVRNAMVVHLSL